MNGNESNSSNGGKLHRLYISKPNDRESVIVILARNGYTVRQGRMKNDRNKYVYFVEYWKEDVTA